MKVCFSATPVSILSGRTPLSPSKSFTQSFTRPPTSLWGRSSFPSSRWVLVHWFMLVKSRLMSLVDKLKSFSTTVHLAYFSGLYLKIFHISGRETYSWVETYRCILYLCYNGKTAGGACACPLKDGCVSVSDLPACDDPPHLGHCSHGCVISTRQVWESYLTALTHTHTYTSAHPGERETHGRVRCQGTCLISSCLFIYHFLFFFLALIWRYFSLTPSICSSTLSF